MKRATLGLVLVAGCVTTPPVRGGLKLPPDSAVECERLCASIGLSLSAVVVVQNSVGCVCQAKNGAPAAGGATAMAATIIALERQRVAESIPQPVPLDDPSVQLQHR